MDEKKDLDYILEQLVDILDNPRESEIGNKLEVETFGSLKGNDYLTEYLRKTLGCDVKRYFSASSDNERSQIRGAFSRTAYLLGKIQKQEELHK